MDFLNRTEYFDYYNQDLLDFITDYIIPYTSQFERRTEYIYYKRILEMLFQENFLNEDIYYTMGVYLSMVKEDIEEDMNIIRQLFNEVNVMRHNVFIDIEYLDKKGLTSLLKWAEKTAQSVTDLLETLFLESSTFKKNEKLTLMLIKDASSRIKFSQHLPTEIAAINLLAAVQFLIQLLSVDQSKKLSSALASLLQRLVHQVRLSHPTVVIHGPFVMAIKTIQEKLKKTVHKKTAQDTVFQQLGPTLSILADLSTTGGQDSINYGRLLLPSLRSTYPNFDTQFDELTLLCPVLTQLKETDLNVLENNLEDTAISIYARLLPSWHEFYIAENEQGKLASMNTDLLEAAKLNGIEFLNIAGEEVTFDPVVHRLHKSELPATETVCILRPAVIFRRANGTHRIVLPAIVAPI